MCEAKDSSGTGAGTDADVALGSIEELLGSGKRQRKVSEEKSKAVVGHGNRWFHPPTNDLTWAT